MLEYLFVCNLKILADVVLHNGTYQELTPDRECEHYLIFKQLCCYCIAVYYNYI